MTNTQTIARAESGKTPESNGLFSSAADIKNGKLSAFLKGEPGIYPDVPFEKYLSLEELSQSVIKCGRHEDGSMRKLKCAMEEDWGDPTDDMVLGSALHVCFLEPEMMPERVALWEGAARRGKEWDAFKAEHAAKSILTKSSHANLTGMARSLRGTPEVKKWLGKIQHVELSCIGEIEGVKIKARCDALTDDPIWDLKKVRSVDGRTIDRTIYEFGYHIQAYVYTKLFGRTRFCLGMVEGSAPFEPRIVELSERWIELGRFETHEILREYKACQQSGKWPFRYESIDVIEPPGWVEDKFGSKQKITLSGIEI